MYGGNSRKSDDNTYNTYEYGGCIGCRVTEYVRKEIK